MGSNLKNSPSVIGGELTLNSPSIEEVNGHIAIDLGLGVKWADCNVGAIAPYDIGDFFAWEEIKPKSSYTHKNCVTLGKDIISLGAKEKFDALCSIWGVRWRLLHYHEIQDLINKIVFFSDWWR